MNRTTESVRPTPRAARFAGLVLLLVTAPFAHAIVTPAPDRTFGTNAEGQDIVVQMARESGNVTVRQATVRFINNAPVDVDSNGVPDFLTWSGTLFSPEWVLTCAHALQGTNGRGGGLVAGSVECWTDDGQILSVASFTNLPAWQKEQHLLGNDLALVRLGARLAASKAPGVDEIEVQKRFGPDARVLSPPHDFEKERTFYFEDLPRELQNVLRVQLRQPGDVSAVIETPGGFLLYVARDCTDAVLSVAGLSLPKRCYEQWLEEQTQRAP